MRRSTKKRLWRGAVRDARLRTYGEIARLADDLRALRGEPQSRRYGEMLLVAMRRVGRRPEVPR